MVFFNWATMQMAAKIVYYGPGLCGKTTNLSFIYAKTSPNSRGEMVSLETESDRTLFFDLLPIEVGTIGGFKTRLQLYTVPGQVFYNTTRKLVLKGVDGVVFVADSQRPMREANIESFANLRENLAELGLELDEVPLVLQYNKRDLQNTLTLDELNQDLNPDRSLPFQESSAVNGDGVFETLKKITKLTLKKLRRRMASPDTTTTSRPAAAPVRPKPAAPDSRPATISAAALARAAEEGVESRSEGAAAEEPAPATPAAAAAAAPAIEPAPDAVGEPPPPPGEPQSAPFEVVEAAEDTAPENAGTPFPVEGEPADETAEEASAEAAAEDEIEPDTEPEFDEPPVAEAVEEDAPAEVPEGPPDDVAVEEAPMAAEAVPDSVEDEIDEAEEVDQPAFAEPEPDDDDVSDSEVEFDHAEDEPAAPAATPPVKRVQVSNQMDILAELDSLRKQATMGGQEQGTVARAPELDLDSLLSAPKDRKKELKRTIQKAVNSDIFQSMHGVQLAIRIQDRAGETIHILDPVTLPVSDSGGLDSLSLRLTVDLENHK